MDATDLPRCFNDAAAVLHETKAANPPLTEFDICGGFRGSDPGVFISVNRESEIVHIFGTVASLTKLVRQSKTLGELVAAADNGFPGITLDRFYKPARKSET